MNTLITADFPWLTVIIAVPLVAAIVLGLVKPLHRSARAYGLVVSVVVAVLTVVALVSEFDVSKAGQTQLAEVYSWMPFIGVSLAWGVTGMSAVLILMSVFLVPLVILAAHKDRFLRAGEEEAGRRDSGYIAWILALEAIIIALFAAADLFVFYVLFETMLLPVYFLIGSYGGPKRKAAAMKFLIYSLAGGLIMLLGVIAVFVAGPGGPQGFLFVSLAGSITGSSTAKMLMFLAFFIPLAIKAPMWPFHTWLADSAEQAPAGTSTLLVGVLDKFGAYGMILICLPLFPEASESAAPVIMAAGVVSIIWGGLMAIGSHDLMRLIAYSSVSHFGFMIMGIFSGSSVAMAGAILYMVAHGVSIAGLFLISGFLAHRGGSQWIPDFGGWQRVTPIIAGTFLVAGLATLALPGLSGFVPEYLVLLGTFSQSKVVAGFAVIGIVLAALYILLPYQRLFTGPRPDVTVPDLGGSEKTTVGLLIAAMLFLGLYPAPVLDMVRPVAEQTTAQADSTATAATEGIVK